MKEESLQQICDGLQIPYYSDTPESEEELIDSMNLLSPLIELEAEGEEWEWE